MEFLGPCIPGTRQERGAGGQRRPHHGQAAEQRERQAADHPDGLPTNPGNEEPSHQDHHTPGQRAPAVGQHHEAPGLQEPDCHDRQIIER